MNGPTWFILVAAGLWVPLTALWHTFAEHLTTGQFEYRLVDDEGKTVAHGTATRRADALDQAKVQAARLGYDRAIIAEDEKEITR